MLEGWDGGGQFEMVFAKSDFHGIWDIYRRVETEQQWQTITPFESHIRETTLPLLCANINIKTKEILNVTIMIFLFTFLWGERGGGEEGGGEGGSSSSSEQNIPMNASDCKDRMKIH